MEKIKRIANFVILTNRDKRGGYVRLESLNGQWRMEWREDSPMYGNILRLCQSKNEILEAYLERLIVCYYVHTNHVHDWSIMCAGGEKKEDGSVDYVPFMSAYWKLVDEAAEREVALAEKPSEEEEEEALKEVVQLAEIEEDLEKEEAKENHE